MRLIITRPKADAERLAARLTSRGHTPVLCPLMKITHRRNIVLPSVKLQAVCASSANGLDADVDWSRLAALPFHAVGPQSADAAQRRGFRAVHIATGGNLTGLVAVIAAKASPAAGAVLYLSGADVSGDLVGLLGPHGIAVERVIAYDVLPTHPENLSTTITGADGVMLYSPRAAKLWVAATSNIDTAALHHFCLSAKVAAQLPPAASITIAQTPDDRGMMELLD